MREQDIGDVLVTDDGQLRGIVTAPDEELDAAITRMREAAVRRIPVVDHDRPVGVLSIGDAAIERDPSPALAAC